MTTTREFVDSHLRCTHCGKKKVIEQDTDGREVHTCLNGCGKPEYVDAAGFVTVGGPGEWPVVPCPDCGADVIECTSIRGLRMFVDVVSGAGIFSLHPVAGRCPQAQYDWGHRSRRLYSSHARTCTAKAVAS